MTEPATEMGRRRVARRGGSGNIPHVRVVSQDPLRIEVWHLGEWVEAAVQQPMVPEVEPCSDHYCAEGPDFCPGYICQSCRWVCPNSPEEAIDDEVITTEYESHYR